MGTERGWKAVGRAVTGEFSLGDDALMDCKNRFRASSLARGDGSGARLKSGLARRRIAGEFRDALSHDAQSAREKTRRRFMRSRSGLACSHRQSYVNEL